MLNIPKPKKNIGAFLIEEEGRISNQSLLKAGTIIATSTLAISTTLPETEAISQWAIMCQMFSQFLRTLQLHNNMLEFNPTGEQEATASHTHCITRFV